jgi:hypothetical protein
VSPCKLQQNCSLCELSKNPSSALPWCPGGAQLSSHWISVWPWMECCQSGTFLCLSWNNCKLNKLSSYGTLCRTSRMPTFRLRLACPACRHHQHWLCLTVAVSRQPDLLVSVRMTPGNLAAQLNKQKSPTGDKPQSMQLGRTVSPHRVPLITTFRTTWKSPASVREPAAQIILSEVKLSIASHNGGSGCDRRCHGCVVLLLCQSLFAVQFTSVSAAKFV